MDTDTSVPTSIAGAESRLLMSKISKTFGPTRVLHDVDLRLAPGEVRGLVGQNGAGKSTLMKILGGIYPDHTGRVYVDGKPVELTTPRQALAVGIGMIYQELSLIQSMTVAENIVLGIEPGRTRFSAKAVRRQAEAVVRTSPLLASLPLDRLVADLGAGSRQMVEIAKAMARQARVLVLDEPTARLSAPERVGLHQLIRQLAEQGTSAIYISHFLDDVLDVTDRITVLRNGSVVAEGATHEFEERDLVHAMLSRELIAEAAEHQSSARLQHAPIVLQVRGLSQPGRFEDVSFTLRRGEILGIAGLVGSGRSRLARALAGAATHVSGTVVLNGKDLTLTSPRRTGRSGLVLVPEDRGSEGIVASATAGENLTMRAYDHGLAPRGWIDVRRRRETVRSTFDELQVHPARPELLAANFSGGNQQKLLLGRALLTKPAVLIADQPTAGVDVGAKAQVHQLLKKAAAAGSGVIVITDDLDELLNLADTVVIMRHGRAGTGVRREDIDHDQLITAISA